MISSFQRDECAAFPGPAFVAPISAPRHDRGDPRWPAITAALVALRERGRCAVRIVDADCATGGLLLDSLSFARKLGFVAIEGRGIDGSPALINRARASASRAPDLAIGVEFEVADVATALEEECELPADILLWPGSDGSDERSIVGLLQRAADVVIDGCDMGLLQAGSR